MFSNLKISVAKKRMAAAIKRSLGSEEQRVQRIGVLLDSEDDALRHHFVGLQKELGLRDNQFQLVTCKDEGLSDNLFQGLVFTRKDLAWNGKIRNGEITTFVEQETDVLISFTQTDNKLAGFLVSVSNAGLKVGRSEGDTSTGLFDLVISTRFEDVDLFIVELKKYLKILNKIE